MTTPERARAIIVEHVTEQVADRIIAALARKRIGFVAIKASEELFVRWHAHARYLGEQTGDGYKGIYHDAIEYAQEFDEWPCKLVVREVEVGGEMISVDILVPESTTKATNRQLLKAYEYITEVAKERGIVLPENTEGI